jgi:hypothetical protein
MKVWDGSQWLNAYASLSGALLANNNLSDLTNTTTARSNLGVAIGTNVQAYDAQLADIAGLTPADNSFIVGNGTNFVAEDASTARTSLGLGTAATTAATDYATAAQGTKADSALQPAAIGVSVQAYDADLATIAGLTPTNQYAIIGNGTSWTSAALPATGVTSVTGTSPVASSGGTTPAISLASGYGDTQNPYASKTANFVLAAPNGSAGAPTFRAVVAADIPTLNQNTTGTSSNVTGTVAIANGGTGATSAATALSNLGAYPASNPSGYTSNAGTVTSVGGTGTVNGISLSGTVTSSGNLTLGGTLSNVSLATQVTGTLPIANGGTGATTRQNAMDALAGSTTSGQYLRGNGTDVVMSAIQAADVPTLNQNTTGTAANVTGTVAIANGGTGQTTKAPAFNALSPITATGDLIIGNGSNSAARLAIGTNGQVLTSNGTTATWAAAGGGGQFFGSAAVKAIAYNANTIGENVTVTTGNNGLSAGPITISNTFTVTVQSGAVWVIV